MDNDTYEYTDFDLKPCPFCGGRASVWTKGERVFWVKCDICQNSIKWGKEVENVVFRWNNRPLEDQLIGEIRSLKSTIQRLSEKSTLP